MSKQLRYLLHGNREKYEDTTTTLYKTSEQSTLWQKLGKQVLQKTSKDWRLIDSLLIEHIPSAKHQKLGIKLLKPEEVIELIDELGADCVDANSLEESERYELLNKIQYIENEELWKKLKLHKTSSGELVNIQPGVTYLENPKFPFDERLAQHIVIIKKNDKLRQDYIDLWTPEALINTVLNFQTPHEYCYLILDALQNLSILDKNQLQNTCWLVDSNQNVIRPQNIVILPKNLQKHLSNIVELSKGEYTEFSFLPEYIKKHQNIKNLKKLFSRWDENNVIEFIFKQSQPHLHFNIIIDTLDNLFNVSKKQPSENNFNNLKNQAWLEDINDNAVFPNNVLHYPSIKHEIEELLLQISSSYIASSQLKQEIRNSGCWQWLHEKLFLTNDTTLLKIGLLLKEADDYQLGEFEHDGFPLDELSEVFKNIDVSFLPAWNFARKLSSDDFRKHLLPNLLGKLDEDKLINILNKISSLNSRPNEQIKNVFNFYLKLVVNKYQNVQNILQGIKLLSRRGEWKSPEELTWGNMGSMDNINAADLLDNKQTEILASYLSTLSKSNISNSTNNLEISEDIIDRNSFQVLQTYFKAWDRCCPSEPIGTFLSLLNTHDKAENKSIQKLAELYLGNRDLYLLRNSIFQNKPVQNRIFNISVGESEDSKTEVTNIIGSIFRARLDKENYRHLFINNLTPNTSEIKLISIQAKDFNKSKLMDLLKQSVIILLQQIYQVNPSSIEKNWQNLLNTDQLDIQVAKNLLLEGAPYVMRNLEVHRYSNKIRELLQEWGKHHHHKAELKHQNISEKYVNQKIEDVLSRFCDFIENDSVNNEQERKHLLEAVRSKIKGHGYRCQSIPFEIFQNADDAVVEWLEMSQQQELENKRKQFIIVRNDNKLLFIHGGRPINCFQHPDNPGLKYKRKGFDRDLEKMLMFNISDKQDGVTGKFGLGFKSIYLTCEQPNVLSKNLGFTVKGGLIPSQIEPSKKNELRQYLDDIIGLIDGTIIELEIDKDINDTDIIDNFKDLVEIMLVFSKQIKSCIFIEANHSKKISWQPHSVLNLKQVEVEKYQNAEPRTLLSFNTTSGIEANLLLCIVEENTRLRSLLPKDTPTFWVTAPTLEKLFLDFAINADFDITAGRESLVKSSERNRKLAKKIGQNIGNTLNELFSASNGNWKALAESLGFKNIDEYEFWNFLWDTLAVSWQSKDSSEGIEIIHCMLMGNDCAMGYLITKCSALPSGLYGNYRQLVSLKNVKYKVTGKLSEVKVFLKIAEWDSFQRQYQNNLITDKKWKEVNKLLSSDFVKQHYTVKELRLLDVLKNELDNLELKVSSQQANYLGQLICKEFLDDLNKSEEFREIHDYLQQLKFKSKDGSYLLSQRLLVHDSKVAEESLLAAFAPSSRILEVNGYTKVTGLKFFYTCRSKRGSISTEEIAEWALQATTSQQQEAVRQYLSEGEQKEKLARILYARRKQAWFSDNQDIMTILDLMNQLTKVGIDFPYPPDETENKNSEQIKPTSFIDSNCRSNDFKENPEEFEAFKNMLLQGLNQQESPWQDYIYHFTHVENAASILRNEKLLARKRCQKFHDSAGKQLINDTREDVKNFARFYLRPQTPTQWHNEGLGKRKNGIYALCPVPIFFRFNMERVLETHRIKCGVSNGNLAAKGSYYGNTTAFLEQGFDFDNIYSTINKVGKEIFFRASQQEFIIRDCLDFTKINLDDVEIICRTPQDKKTLIALIGNNSKYLSRIILEEEIYNNACLFYNENPFIKIRDDNQFITIETERYEECIDRIDGHLILSLKSQTSFDDELISNFSDISEISIRQVDDMNLSNHIQLKSHPNTSIEVYFKEKNTKWLVYKNEPRHY